MFEKKVKIHSLMLACAVALDEENVMEKNLKGTLKDKLNVETFCYNIQKYRLHKTIQLSEESAFSIKIGSKTRKMFKGIGEGRTSEVHDNREVQEPSPVDSSIRDKRTTFERIINQNTTDRLHQHSQKTSNNGPSDGNKPSRSVELQNRQTEGGNSPENSTGRGKPSVSKESPFCQDKQSTSKDCSDDRPKTSNFDPQQSKEVKKDPKTSMASELENMSDLKTDYKTEVPTTKGNALVFEANQTEYYPLNDETEPLIKSYLERKVKRKLKVFFDSCHSDEHCVLFMSGHGKSDGSCLFLNVKVDAQLTFDDIVSLWHGRKHNDQTGASHLLLVVDACYLGMWAFRLEYEQKFRHVNDISVQTSSNKDQTSNDAGGDSGGYFLNNLLYLNGMKDLMYISNYKETHPITNKRVDSQTPTFFSRNDNLELIFRLKIGFNSWESMEWRVRTSFKKSPLGEKTDAVEESFQPSFRGTFVADNGEFFQGEFRSIQLHGVGIKRLSNGRVESGLFKNDKLDGRGKIEWNGTVCEGLFANGRLTGDFSARLSNGTVLPELGKSFETPTSVRLVVESDLLREVRRLNSSRKDKVVYEWVRSLFNNSKVMEGECRDKKRHGLNIVFLGNRVAKVGIWKDGHLLTGIRVDQSGKLRRVERNPIDHFVSQIVPELKPSKQSANEAGDRYNAKRDNGPSTARTPPSGSLLDPMIASRQLNRTLLSSTPVLSSPMDLLNPFSLPRQSPSSMNSRELPPNGHEGALSLTSIGIGGQLMSVLHGEDFWLHWSPTDEENTFQKADMIFRGKFDEDKPKGFGSLEQKSGINYMGHWHNGLPQGFGNYHDSGKNEAYSGFWNEGSREGRGRMVFGNGESYEGNWQSDRGIGMGKFTNSLGNTVEGFIVVRHDQLVSNNPSVSWLFAANGKATRSPDYEQIKQNLTEEIRQIQEKMKDSLLSKEERDGLTRERVSKEKQRAELLAKEFPEDFEGSIWDGALYGFCRFRNDSKQMMVGEFFNNMILLRNRTVSRKNQSYEGDILVPRTFFKSDLTLLDNSNKIRNFMKHGYGKLEETFDDRTEIFEGFFHLGEKAGNGKLLIVPKRKTPDSQTASDQSRNTPPISQQPDNSGVTPSLKTRLYEGHFYMNSVITKLKMGFGDRSIFEGYCVMERLDSQLGTLPNVYQGDWINLRKIGFGSHQRTADGSYVGMFFNNNREGFGVLRKGSTRYEGEFSKNQRNGKGRWTDSENGLVFEGELNMNKRHGFGVLTKDDHFRFVGHFENDLFCGHGCLRSDQVEELVTRLVHEHEDHKSAVFRFGSGEGVRFDVVEIDSDTLEGRLRRTVFRQTVSSIVTVFDEEKEFFHFNFNDLTSFQGNLSLNEGVPSSLQLFNTSRVAFLPGTPSYEYWQQGTIEINDSMRENGDEFSNHPNSKSSPTGPDSGNGETENRIEITSDKKTQVNGNETNEERVVGRGGDESDQTKIVEKNDEQTSKGNSQRERDVLSNEGKKEIKYCFSFRVSDELVYDFELGINDSGNSCLKAEKTVYSHTKFRVKKNKEYSEFKFVPNSSEFYILRIFSKPDLQDQLYVWRRLTESYIGNFQKGEKHGKSRNVLVKSDGDCYVGGFKNNRFEGRGVLTNNLGFKYEGHFRNGHREGFGVMNWNKRQIYKGEFKMDLENGFGELSDSVNFIYKGTFKNGKFHGLGKLVREEYFEYEGEFSEGYLHGKGNFKYHLSRGYQGNFQYNFFVKRHENFRFEDESVVSGNGCFRISNLENIGKFSQFQQYQKVRVRTQIDPRRYYLYDVSECVHDDEPDSLLGLEYLTGDCKITTKSHKVIGVRMDFGFVVGSGVIELTDGSFYLGEFLMKRRRENAPATEHTVDDLFEFHCCHGRGVRVDTEDAIKWGEFFLGEFAKGVVISPSTDVFFGCCEGEMKSGLGECRHSNGDVFQGHFRNDQRHGEGLLKTKDYVYVGDFVADQLDGNGTLFFADSLGLSKLSSNGVKKHSTNSQIRRKLTEKQKIIDSLQQSSFKHTHSQRGLSVSRKTSANTLVEDLLEWEDPTEASPGEYEMETTGRSFVGVYSRRYTGQFVEGELRGEGEYLLNDSSQYSGRFESGEMRGPGVFQTMNTSEVEEGDFVNGLLNGFGKRRIQGEYSYVGEFLNDQFHNYGELTTNKKEFRGHFQRGVFHGHGVLKVNNSVYDGQFVGGRREGYGSIRFKQKYTCTGVFKDNKLHGPGTLKIGSDSTICEFVDSKIRKTVENFENDQSDNYSGECLLSVKNMKNISQIEAKNDLNSMTEKHGWGVLRFASGYQYAGVFENDYAVKAIDFWDSLFVEVNDLDLINGVVFFKVKIQNGNNQINEDKIFKFLWKNFVRFLKGKNERFYEVIRPLLNEIFDKSVSEDVLLQLIREASNYHNLENQIDAEELNSPNRTKKKSEKKDLEEKVDISKSSSYFGRQMDSSEGNHEEKIKTELISKETHREVLVNEKSTSKKNPEKTTLETDSEQPSEGKEFKTPTESLEEDLSQKSQSNNQTEVQIANFNKPTKEWSVIPESNCERLPVTDHSNETKQIKSPSRNIHRKDADFTDSMSQQIPLKSNMEDSSKRRPEDRNEENRQIDLRNLFQKIIKHFSSHSEFASKLQFYVHFEVVRFNHSITEKETSEIRKFTGNFKNGMWKKGIVFMKNGDEIEGNFKNFKINKFGKLKFANGDSYEGFFKNGEFHGYGKITYSNKLTYEGNFKNGKFDGFGRLIFPDKLTHEKQLKNEIARMIDKLTKCEISQNIQKLAGTMRTNDLDENLSAKMDDVKIENLKVNLEGKSGTINSLKNFLKKKALTSETKIEKQNLLNEELQERIVKEIEIPFYETIIQSIDGLIIYSVENHLISENTVYKGQCLMKLKSDMNLLEIGKFEDCLEFVKVYGKGVYLHKKQYEIQKETIVEGKICLIEESFDNGHSVQKVENKDIINQLENRVFCNGLSVLQFAVKKDHLPDIVYYLNGDVFVGILEDFQRSGFGVMKSYREELGQRNHLLYFKNDEII